MAYPKWYNDEQTAIQAKQAKIERNEGRISDIRKEIAAKNGEIAHMESENASLAKEIETPKLPILLFYNIRLLGGPDGRDLFYHERTYYYADKNKLDTHTNIFSTDSRNLSLMPGAIDLTIAFGKSGVKDAPKIAEGIAATVQHLLEDAKVSSWEHMGELLRAYYSPCAE